MYEKMLGQVQCLMNEEIYTRTKKHDKINLIEEIKMEMLRKDQRKLWMK